MRCARGEPTWNSLAWLKGKRVLLNGKSVRRTHNGASVCSQWIQNRSYPSRRIVNEMDLEGRVPEFVDSGMEP